jgi:LacI family transcriptional regulator
MTTIYDIAKQTGFAPATVSKALNNYNGVKRETREAIISAAREMKYAPNTAARSLTTKKTWLVGVLFSDEMQTGIAHSHFGSILASAQSRFAELGYDVVFVSNNMSGSRMSYYDHCVTRGVEGVILAASLPATKSVKCILDSDFKMVSVETPYPGKYSVLSDNRQGIGLAIEHLYELGHRDIAYIACPWFSTAGQERNAAMIEFMTARGLSLPPEWMIETEEYSVEAGYAGAKKLMDGNAKKPTAIFVGDGEAAVGVLNYLEDIDYKVPEQVTVVEFDNLVTSMARRITSIDQNRTGMGTLAADLLIGQIEGHMLPYSFDNRLETKLIRRDTCRRI